MIQRIQSLYLLGAALTYVGTLLLPVIRTGVAAQQEAWFQPTAVVVGALAALIALVSILLYKNRATQRKVALAGQYLGLLFAFVVYLGFYMSGSLAATFAGPDMAQTVLALGLPLLGYLFYSLARRGIDRDINLIRSMDRLR